MSAGSITLLSKNACNSVSRMDCCALGNVNSYGLGLTTKGGY